MENSYAAIEERISDAIKVAQSQKKPNIRALARDFNVPYSRLYGRFNGQPSRSERPPTNSALDSYQEKALIRWIQQLDDLYIPPTPKLVEQQANKILQHQTDASRSVSKMWAYRFIQRLPNDFSFTKQKPMDKKRIDAEDVGYLSQWYDVLERFIKHTRPRNIYNFDETGFQIGQLSSQKVVTKYPYKTSRIGAASTRESLTAIECIAADGWSAPPFFIVRGEQHLERWYHDSLPKDYVIAPSANGFITDQLALNWLQHFHQHTYNRARGEQRILLFDGHGSHLTFEFLQFCEQHNILPFCFLPHTTHFAQPLDGKPFLTYKNYYRHRNTEVSQWGGSVDDKSDFFREIASIRENTFKPPIIRHAFADRGICPFKSEKILQPLTNALPHIPDLLGFDPDGADAMGRTPSPHLSSSSIESPTTPYSARRSIQKMEKVMPTLDESSPDPAKLQRRWSRFSKYTLIEYEDSANKSTIIRRFQRTQTTQTTTKSRRRIKEFGPLSTKDANRHIKRRAEVEGGREQKRHTKEMGKKAAVADLPPPILSDE